VGDDACESMAGSGCSCRGLTRHAERQSALRNASAIKLGDNTVRAFTQKKQHSSSRCREGVHGRVATGGSSQLQRGQASRATPHRRGITSTAPRTGLAGRPYASPEMRWRQEPGRNWRGCGGVRLRQRNSHS
jgi:hypothetical protein